MRRALAVGGVLAVVAAGARTAAAQDAWVSPKDRPTALDLGDRGLEPQGALKLFDAIRVHPSLRQTLTWDDNIFLAPRDEDDDLISITSVGLRLDLLPGNWEITAGSRFRWEEYLDHRDESHADSVTDVHVNWRGRTWKFELRETFEMIEEPVNQVVARRLERVVNTVGLAVRAEFARVGFDVEAEDANLDFRAPFGDLDHREDSVGLTGRLLVASERTLFVQYRLGLLDYFRDFRADYQTHEALAGWRGRLSSKTEGEVAAGWLVQAIDPPAGGVAGAEYNGPVGRAQFSWSPTPRLALRARYRTGVQFGQLTTWQRVDRGELSGEWRRPQLDLVTRLFGYVENNDPPGLPPFLNAAVGLTVDWDWQPWLSVGAGVEYRWRTTDIPDADYANLRAWVHFTAYL